MPIIEICRTIHIDRFKGTPYVIARAMKKDTLSINALYIEMILTKFCPTFFKTNFIQHLQQFISFDDSTAMGGGEYN